MRSNHGLPAGLIVLYGVNSLQNALSNSEWSFLLPETATRPELALFASIRALRYTPILPDQPLLIN